MTKEILFCISVIGIFSGFGASIFPMPYVLCPLSSDLHSWIALTI
jgi:hypothetical protein